MTARTPRTEPAGAAGAGARALATADGAAFVPSLRRITLVAGRSALAVVFVAK